MSDFIGNTPLVDLSSISPNPNVTILGKCEFMNPGLSIKDRTAKHIIEHAEETGQLRKGGTVVVASSGNTATSIAMMCALKGYKSHVILTEKCSKEKIDCLKGYGTKITIAKHGLPSDHPDHFQNIEKRLCKENPSYYGVDQFDNPNNPEAYFHTLGPEIWRQTKGRVTHFVAAAGTGGTITGVSRYLKTMKPSVKSVCPDPYGSRFYDYWIDGRKRKCQKSDERRHSLTGHANADDEVKATYIPSSPKKRKLSAETTNGVSKQSTRGKGRRKSSSLLEGIGRDSATKVIDFDIIDDMPSVSDKLSFDMCHRVAREEGLLVGGSSGFNLGCAFKIAKEYPAKGKAEPATIVAILCDSGVKYLSKIYDDEWLEAHKDVLHKER